MICLLIATYFSKKKKKFNVFMHIQMYADICLYVCQI